MKKTTIAVFDFDGTLTQKDTLFEFIKFSKGKFQFYGTFLLFLPLLVIMKLRLLPNWQVKQLIFSFLYKNVSISEFDLWGIYFVHEIDKILRPKALETLKQHKENGDKIVIISASIENWIIPWAKKQDIDTVLATKIEIFNKGNISGSFLTKNCYGQEKVNRFLEMFPNRNDYYIIAYGDSRGDKEMIEFANEGYYNKFK